MLAKELTLAEVDKIKEWKKNFYNWDKGVPIFSSTKKKEIITSFDSVLFLYYCYIYVYILVTTDQHRTNINSQKNIYLRYIQLNVNMKQIYLTFQYNVIYTLVSLNYLFFFNFMVKNNIGSYYMKNNEIFIYIDLFKKNVTFFKYTYRFLQKISDFIHRPFIFKMRINMSLFLFFRKYIYYVFWTRYNEYVKYHSFLKTRPRLKLILLCRILKYKFKKYIHSSSWPKPTIYNSLQIYCGTVKYVKEPRNHMIWSSKDQCLYYNKFAYLKLLPLLQNRYLYFHTTLYNVVYYYLYVYDILIFANDTADWQELMTWKPDSLYNTYWQVNRYGFFIEWWIYTRIYGKLLKQFKLKCYIILNLLLKKTQIIMNSNILCWYLLTKLILVRYIKNLYYRFYSDFIYLKQDLDLPYFRAIWLILTRFKIIYWGLINHKNTYILDDFIQNKNNIDSMTWRIFFSANPHYRMHLNLDITLTVKKLFMDNNVNTLFRKHEQNLILHLNSLFLPENLCSEELDHEFITNVPLGPSDLHYSTIHIYAYQIYIYLHNLYYNIYVKYNYKFNYLLFKTYKNVEIRPMIRSLNVWQLKENYYTYYANNKRIAFDYNVEIEFVIFWVLLFIIRYWNAFGILWQKTLKKNAKNINKRLLSD